MKFVENLKNIGRHCTYFNPEIENIELGEFHEWLNNQEGPPGGGLKYNREVPEERVKERLKNYEFKEKLELRGEIKRAPYKSIDLHKYGVPRGVTVHGLC